MKAFIAILLTALVYTVCDSASVQKRDVSDELKLRLMTDVTRLLAKTEELQTKLNNTGKLAEAIALEALVMAIKEVETELVNLHPNSTVGQILLVAAEATLGQIEKKLEAEVEKLENGGRRKRQSEELKLRLMTDVTKLLAKVEQLQTKLNDTGKLAEAVALEALVLAIKEVETELVNLHPNDTVGQILLVAAEATLAEIEKKIEAEVAKLENGGRKKRDANDELKLRLMTDVTRLLAKVEQLQVKMNDTGKLAEAVALEALVLAIKEVETELLNLHPNSTVGQILLVAAEATLVEIEKKIEAEVAKLENGGRKKRDANDELKLRLMTDVTRLLAKVEQLQVKMNDTGKLAEAVALEALVLAIKEVETELLNLHPNSTVGQILLVAAEATLAEIEKKVEVEVAKLENGGRKKRDTKADVIAKAEALLAEAAALELQLQGTGKANEAVELAAEIAVLELLVQQLENLKGNSIQEQLLIVAGEQAVKAEEAKLQKKLDALKESA